MSLLPRFPKVFSSWPRQESFNDHIDTDLKTIESLITSSSIKQNYNTIASGVIDGTNTSFVLTTSSSAGYSNIIFTGGVPYKSSDFTIVGTALNFTTAPANGLIYDDFIILTWS